MNGALLTLPQYAFTAWLSVEVNDISFAGKFDQWRVKRMEPTIKNLRLYFQQD
jgi:hypothetical protein